MSSDLAQCKKTVDRVTRIFTLNHSFSKTIAERAEKLFGDEWTLDFGQALDVLFENEEALAAAIKGYAAFAMDALRRQKKFELERTYETTSFAQAAEDVYFNEAYMLGQYLPGLLLSHYLWPHHYRQLKYFMAFFVAPMKRAGAERFAEVGVGTGIYSRVLLAEIPNAHGTGFDISSYSRAFAHDHLKAFGFESRYELRLQDIMEDRPGDTFEWLICVEVLEHLEDPLTFLRSLRAMLAPGGKAFITAALNAANADHIYLYENAGQVLEQLEQAGFALEQYFYATAYAPASTGLPVPAVAAFIVS